MLTRSLGFALVVGLVLAGASEHAFAQGYPAPPPPPAGGPGGEPPAEQSGLIAKGVKAGINSAGLSFSEDFGEGVDVGRSLGLALGVFGVVAAGPNTSIQVEALYSQKGASESVDGLDADISINLDYLEGVGLVRYDLADQGQTRPFIFAGGAVGLKVRAEVTASGDDVESGTEDISDETSAIDVGLVVGGGAAIATAGGSAITIDVRYTHGLLNVDDTDDDITVTNNCVSVMFGYGI